MNNPAIKLNSQRISDICGVCGPTSKSANVSPEECSVVSSDSNSSDGATDAYECEERVEVILQHAINQNLLTIMVPSDATIFEVRLTAAFELKNEEVLQFG